MSDGPPTWPVPALPGRLGDDGRYEVVGQLGAGGMGLVVRARDTVLGREVAIKLLADNLAADPDARARFLHEARSAAAIHDPRVVAVHDVGEHQGRPYLVMERVEGGSLAEALAAEGPFDGDDVADAAVDALAGLARAHEAGLLHRDVKPGNLLRADDGTVKVTDFGVATAADAPNLTRDGFVMGTAAYLAPERRRGEPATVRTDLWALGATLLEVLTGHPPSDEADAALAARSDELPGGLRRLLAALLADDPEARPASALDALDLLAGETSIAGAAGGATPTARTDATTQAIAAHGDARPPGPPGGAPRDVTAPLPLEATAEEDPAATSSAERARWARVAAVAVLLLLAVVALQVVASDEGGSGDPFEVVVDADDPAGTARDLAESLRGRAAD